MSALSSPQLRYPSLDIFSSDHEDHSFLSEVSVAPKPNMFKRIFKAFFFLLLLPIWLLVSFAVEVIVVPLNIAFQFIRDVGEGCFWKFVIVLVSPLVLCGVIIMACLLSPVSVVTKSYLFFKEEEFGKALRELIYPKVHPIFDKWLKQESYQMDNYCKKKKFFVSTETAETYPPPFFYLDNSFYSKENKENGKYYKDWQFEGYNL